jgi:sigma-E factor negative regulatory protein RseA
MHSPDSDDTLDPASLSALCDGEVEDAVASPWLQAWSGDAELRERWHRYAVIGDVMRSSDLGRGAGDASAFLATLRVRLQAPAAPEAPDVALPQDLPAPGAAGQRSPVSAAVADSAVVITLDDARRRQHRRTRRWAMPAGIAAGVALVAGLLVVGREPADDSLARADGSDREVRLVDRNGRRDPRMDSYLAAHRQFQPATALGPSSGFLRSAAYEVGPDR